MNIDRIYIRGLFDDWDHELAFLPGEHIMLLVGPNGSGKTTVLKLINMLFKQSFAQLCNMPFREVNVLFDNESQLTARREPADPDSDLLPLTLTFHQDGKSQSFQPPKLFIDPRNVEIPLSAVEDYVPSLVRSGPRRWHDLETGSMLDLTDVLTTFPDYFPPDFQGGNVNVPDWLRDIKNSVEVFLIDTERLTRVSWGRRPYDRAMRATRTVTHYSKRLGDRIQNTIAEYGVLSQSLDSTFPARLVTSGEQLDYPPVETLQEDLDMIKQKRHQLENVGILVEEESGLDIPNLKDVEKLQLKTLAVYAEDAKKKLEVFDDLHKKISAFKRIIDSRFSHKRVSVNKNGLHIQKDDDTRLSLHLLSSGEQHELVMLYEMLFRASDKSLILIDEPELSLHVSWQDQWLKDLEEAAILSNFRAIAATHSPVIINDKWHLTVELSIRNKDR